MRDIFKRDINIGDYILIPATYYGKRLTVLFAKILDIDEGEHLISCTFDADELRKEIPNSKLIPLQIKVRRSKKKTSITKVDEAIKLVKEDIDLEYNDNKYLYNILSSNSVQDIAKRELRMGDFVLVFDKNYFYRTKYGIVISSDSVYVDSHIIKAKTCFKLEHPTSDEQKIYKNLASHFQEYSLKLQNTNALCLGDVFMNSNRDIRYIYIGQFRKKVVEKSKFYNNLGNVIYESDSELTYIYLKFNLKNVTDKHYFDIFLRNNYLGDEETLIKSYLNESQYNSTSHSVSHLVNFKHPKKFNNYLQKCGLDFKNLNEMNINSIENKNVMIRLKLYKESKLDNSFIIV